MKKIITILTVALIATITANAGTVTSWSDNFDGADGTPVATTAKWDATNITWKVMGGSWTDYDRVGDNDDQYIISNNQFYSYVGPCTLYTNVDMRQQVKVSYIPKEAGERIYMDLSNGIVTLELDLESVWGNEGNRWGANQEFKVVLPAAPLIIDSHTVTNYCQITFGMRKATDSNVVIKAEAGNTSGGAIPFASTDNVPTTLTPKTAKLVVQAVAGDTVIKFYVDDTLIGSTNSAFTAAQMATLHPYIWYGKFTGDGETIADGAIFVDNYSLKWALAEPSAFLLVLLAVPLWKRFRG